MGEFANITDLETMKLFFYIESVVLVIAFGVIGYFLRRRDNASIKREEAVTAATEGLTSAVNQLKIVVASLQVQYEIRQPIIDAQLELYRKTFVESAITVKDIDNRLIQIETEHKLLTCKYPGNKNKSKNNEITD